MIAVRLIDIFEKVLKNIFIIWMPVYVDSTKI